MKKKEEEIYKKESHVISISITIVIAAMAVYALSSPSLLARGVAGARGQWTGVG